LKSPDGPSGGWAAAQPTVVWHRLHPLTPAVGGGRSIILMAVITTEQAALKQPFSDTPLLIVLGALALTAVLTGTVKYMVTRWALDGPTLRIETGLLRRDARKLPLARIQAVDVVKPFLARTMGLAELRVRLAGSSRAGGHLAYLSEPVAWDLRARLLAGHYGLDQSTPEPAASPIATVGTGKLVASAVLAAAPPLIVSWLVLAALLVLTPSTSAAPRTIGAGTFLLALIGFVRQTWRRVGAQYGFTVSLAPDGIRLHHGLLSTVSETVPLARVQAVRRVEPLIWRLFGWCRLEVDVAGSPGEEQGTRSGRVTKALLPVGQLEVADQLFSSLLGLQQFPLRRPPTRAALKSPLGYHFLAAASSGTVVAATTGRLRKVTTWIPLQKVQSVRWAQGPLQRALHLATVHVDAAGRRASAQLRDRADDEAGLLFQQLVTDSRAARKKFGGQAAPAPGFAPAVGAPAGTLAPLVTGQPAAPPASRTEPADAGKL